MPKQDVPGRTPLSPREEPLELADIPPRAARVAMPEAFSAEGLPQRPRRDASLLLRGLLVLAGLGAVGSGLYALWSLRERLPQGLTLPGSREEAPVTVLAPEGAAPDGTLLVLSQPAGATVRVQGRVVGTTPLAMDNTWSGEVPVELSLPGYRVWRGHFRGGEAAQVSAALQRR